ncbi:MAG: FISUMP domain-containing protein [Bacteroidales bacterium]|nr:FISUMP domain-containing protein [Bacteroidales bacterium]MDY6348414.1 FISUMP domain-containing protein [Bacteroidales bacterium]
MSNITIYGRDNNKDWGIPGEYGSYGVRANLFADSKSSLEEVYFNNTKFEHVSYMCQMFSGASNLLRVEMKGSNIAPDLVLTNLMFQDCENLEYLDVSGLGKLNKIVNMDYFVSGCTNLDTLIIDNLDNSRIKPKNNYHKASTVDAGAAALPSSADVDWGCQLGIESCTSLVTLSAKNAKVWMRYNKFGNPGNQLYDASSDENILYFTQRKTEFFADALNGASTAIATKRDYIDLITDRDGVNMPSLVGTSANFPDLQTNINIKNGDLNTAGCGFLAPGVYNISNSPWDEIMVGVDSMTYYRIAYLQTRPYAVEGKEYAESKGLVFFEYNEPLNNKLHTHVNTVNRHYSEWGNSGSYVIDLSEEPLVFKYENAAIDVNGKLHDVNISISKITFKDLDRIPTRQPGRVHDGNRYSDDGNGLYFRPIIRATQGDGIMFLNYARRGNPTLGSLVNNNENFSILTGGSGTEIEFKVEIDSANDGTSFVFNSNDLDVPESQEWFYPSNDACYDSLPIDKVYFGVGGESFELGSGNDLSTINFADHTGLLVVDNNKIITTGSDPSTSWSEFSVVANAKGANYKWSSGVGCTTYALRDTRPLNINTVSIQAMATKALVNDTALKANEFEFVLEEDSITPAGAPKPTGINFPATVTNAADGKILFNLLTYKYEQANPLIYDSLYYPGTSPVNNEHGKGKHNTFIYRYKLYEKDKSATKPEYAYDTTVRNIEILIRTPENEVELKKGILAVISVDGSVVDSVWSRQDTVTASLTTFRNKVSKLNLVKNWIDIDTNTRPADLRGFVTYNNGGADTTVYTESGKWVKANDTTWIYQIPFSSTATVKNWGEAVVPQGYDSTGRSRSNDTLFMTNTLKKFDVTIKNTVKGNGADSTRQFTFTIQIDSMANKTIDVTILDKNGAPKDTTFTLTSTGLTTFKLKHGDSLVIKDIPYGTEYSSIIETDPEDYTVTSTVDYEIPGVNPGDPSKSKSDTATTKVAKHTVYSDHNVVFLNIREVVWLVKIWDDDSSRFRPTGLTGFVTYNNNGADTTVNTSSSGWTKLSNNTWIYEFVYPITATIKTWGETTVPTGYDSIGRSRSNDTLFMTNALKRFNITVFKTVKVDGVTRDRHRNQEFTYKFTLINHPNYTIPALKNGADTILITGSDSVATFKLRHGDTIVLKNIPLGSSYMLEEIDYGFYTATTDLTGDDIKTDDANGGGSDIPFGSGSLEPSIHDSFIRGNQNIGFINSIRTIKLEADWNDEKDITGIRPDSVGGYIEYTYNGVKDTIKTGTWTKVDSVWQSQEFDIPTTATVTNWGEEDVPEGYEYEKGTDTGNVYKFFNNLKYLDVLVSKTVKVDGTKAARHTSKEFTYTLTTLANRTIPAVKNSTDSVEITTNAGGVATFKLKDADTMRLTRIPYGAGYSVVEGDYGIYAVSSAVTGADTKTFDNTADSAAIVAGAGKDTITDSFLKGDVAIAYTNSIKVIKLEASWNDEQDITGIRPGNIDGYIEYTYKGVTDSLKTDNWVKVDTVWTQEFDFPTTATVTNWGEENVPTGYDFVKGSGVDSVYKFANNLQYFDLNVSNTVEVDGVKADRHKNKDFTYTVSTSLPGRTIVLKKTTASGDTLISLTTNASGVLSFTLKDGETAIVQDLPYGSTFSMNESDYDIYAVSSVVSDGSTTQNNNGSNVSTRTIKSDVNVAYTNKIMVLTLEKTWHDGGSPIRPENLKGYINYTYNSASGTLSTFDTAWVKTDSVWKHDFDVHVNTIVNNWGENTVPTGYEYARGERVGNVLKMANNLRKHNVTVKNTVSGDGADKNKPFSYTMILKDPNGDPIANTSYTVTQIDAGGTTTTTTFTTDNTGKVTFQLKHNETVEFHSFPYGTKYTISEGDYVPYTVTSKLSYYSGSELKTFDYTGPNVSEQNVFSNHTLIYNNHLQYVDVVFPGLPIQKRIVGRQWNDSDKFVFALIPADDDNPMPVKLYTDTVNDVIYSPLTIAKDSTQGENEYHRAGSFGEITFTATDLDLAHGETEKTFVYHVRELHPAEGGVMIPYITYSVARYRVELTLYIDGDNKLALKDPVYKQEVVVNGHTTLTDAATPFIFTNVFDNVKKNHRVDAEKVLTSRGMTKHLKDFAYHFTLKPVGINADYAPMPENTDTLADNTRQYTASNENHAIRFYNDTPISDDNLGDGLLFDLTVLYPIFGRAELEAGVPFIYEISENIPDDCINNGDGTWQRTVTEDGKTYIDMYDGIVHYRQINVKYVEVGGEGTITTEAVASDDANFQDFYYTDQAKTQKHVLTDEEKTAQAMSGGAPVFHNYAIALRDIAVDKDWKDHDDEYKVRPASVTVRLLRDGVATGETVVLSESNSWAGKFENLQMGDRRSNYTYTVEEIVPNHYEPTYTVDSTHVSISNRVVSLGDDPVCGTIVGEDMFSSNPTIDCGTLTDPRDGQTYTTARINGYCWMTENLRYKSHYAKAYSSTLSPDGEANVETYGYLYNWQEAANLPSPDASPVYVNGYVHGICPEGWHLPTINEINVLHTYDAFALKSFDKWVDEGYNSSQFNALPGGYYNDNKERCEGLLTDAWFHGDSNTTAFCIQYSCCSTSRNKVAGKNFYSVRCVKDVH